MRTGPVAERIEQIRMHMLREQHGEITCDHARTHREELLGYVDTLTRDLEDKTDAYNTLLGQFDQQRELCVDHTVELAKSGVRAETEAESPTPNEAPSAVHGAFGGDHERRGGQYTYIAPCGAVAPRLITSSYSDITCDGCVEALS